MASTVEVLTRRGLINPPSDVKSNTMFETVTGSVAYGVSDDLSDFDVVGFFIPAADRLFVKDHLLGFDPDLKCPKAWQKHHIDDPDALGGKGRMYDLNIYAITQYFRLCMDNNPNMIDTLFTPRDCILHSTIVSEMVRENRKLFPHKGCWVKYKGYAFSQLHKMDGKDPEEGSKRHKLRERYGFDVKFAYHLVRLLYEAEMLLTEGEIEPRRHNEHLKAIRRGEVSEDDIREWAAEKEKYLERAYEETTLREQPARTAIKNLLVDCLEQQYGTLAALENCKRHLQPESVAIQEIKKIVERF